MYVAGPPPTCPGDWLARALYGGSLHSQAFIPALSLAARGEPRDEASLEASSLQFQ